MYLRICLCLACSGAAFAAEPLQLARLEPASIPAPMPGKEKLILPQQAREPVLLAAHHAYTVWSQQFMGVTLRDDQTSAWREFLGMDIRMGDAFRQMGATAYSEGKFEDAYKLLTTAMDFLEPDVELYSQLGYTAKSVGRYEKALEVLRKASELDSARPEVWLWLGDTQRLLGDYESAYSSFVTAKELAPPEHAGTLDEYLAYTSYLKDLTPAFDGVETHLDFAKRHEEQGRVLRMIAEIDAALSVAPDVEDADIERLYRLGWAQLQLGTQWAYYKYPELAVDYYLQSLATYQRANSNTDLMRVHQSLALAYEAIADRYIRERTPNLELAAQQWEKSFELASAAGDAEYLRHVQGGLLAVLAQIRPVDDPRIVELREALQKEIPFRPPINDFTIASATRGEIAARVKEGDLGGARTLIEMSDGYYKDTGFLVDLEHRARALAQLAAVYQEQGHSDKAIAVTRDAIGQIGALRKYLDADGYMRSGNPVTERRIAAVAALASLKLDKPQDALAALEVYHNQNSINLLGSRIRDEEWRTDFATEEQLLLAREGTLRQRLEEATAAGDATRAQWYQERLDYIAERVKRLPLAEALTPGGRISIRQVEVLQAADTQSNLPEGAAVLHLFSGERQAVAVLVTRDAVQGYRPGGDRGRPARRPGQGRRRRGARGNGQAERAYPRTAPGPAAGIGRARHCGRPAALRHSLARRGQRRRVPLGAATLHRARRDGL
jgi:tetratricopeptide (TPR) repeat protein